MTIRKGIVPLAGLGTRLYPVSTVIPKGLFPFVLPDGQIKTGIQLIVEMLVDSGIEQIGVVVSPDTLDDYRRFFSGYPARYAGAWQKKPRLRSVRDELCTLEERITYIIQEEPYGFGHAVWCAHEFADGEPALVMLGDHLLLSHAQTPCAKQVMEIAARYEATMIGVHRIQADHLDRYGVVKGNPTQDRNVYHIADVIEKPSIEEARQHLAMSELPDGYYLAHFGLFAFTPIIWNVLAQMQSEFQPGHGEWQLTHAEQRLLQFETCYALEVDGTSLDYGIPEGYRMTFEQLAKT